MNMKKLKNNLGELRFDRWKESVEFLNEIKEILESCNKIIKFGRSENFRNVTNAKIEEILKGYI